MRLSAVIAIEQTTKAQGNKLKSELYKLAQKPALFDGFSKRYQPKDEGGEKFPDEKHKVQHTAISLTEQVGECLRGLFDIEATKDYANCEAKADIVIDGRVFVTGAPATFLLYLSKELTDLGTFIESLPVLADDEDWIRDAGSGLYRTEPASTQRTKKVQKPIVLYPATPEHPAQTQLIVDDEVVGYWQQTKMSGALAANEKKALLGRVRKLADAVKVAREQANMVEVTEQHAGKVLLGWLFGGDEVK